MTKTLRFLAALLLAVPVFAQAQRVYSQPELDQMLAPIALYPDPLLSQVLMAATYPVEVVEAARWTRANPGLQGDDAVRAVQDADWDPSVKSLVAFPQILQRMDENLEWTRALGDAFLAQEPQVMEQVQQLRRRAQAAGNLQSGEQILVQQQGPTIVLQPASPQYMYVPYYDPMLVYGAWWWPAYRPVHWAPWPGYARAYRPGASVGFWWGRPVGLSLNFFFGGVDWGRREVRVVHPTAYYYRPPVAVVNRTSPGQNHWVHDSQHRRSADYRAAEARPHFAAPNIEHRDERRAEQRPQQRPERIERHEERRFERPAMQAPVQAQPQPRPASAMPPPSERREPRETRPEQRPPMPAAQSVQQPRAERQPPREDRREQRQEARRERGQKS